MFIQVVCGGVVTADKAGSRTKLHIGDLGHTLVSPNLTYFSTKYLRLSQFNRLETQGNYVLGPD